MPSQRSQVLIADPGTPDPPEVLLETGDLLLEAPNWTLDGSALILNGGGLLWRCDLDDPAPRAIGFDGLPPLNNDHVLDPDGVHVLMSADDGHVYRGALTGGPVQRLTPDDGSRHFLHGVSPDGRRLAYVELADFDQPGRLVVLPIGGDPVVVPTGAGHLDGPEWSPDGAWIAFNTEAFGTAPGHAQLARVPDGGGPVERLVHSETVDWFPHYAPAGTLASYLSFPAGTLGHPADLDVVVRVVDTADWSAPVRSYPLRGGQGTINVNSWSPDGSRLAFVTYPGG